MRNVKRNWCHFWRKLASIPKRTFISCPAQDWLEQTLKNSQNSVPGICMYLKLSNLNICYISIKVNASVKLGGSRAWYVVVVCQSAWGNRARATRTQPCNVPMKSTCKLQKIISKTLAGFSGCGSSVPYEHLNLPVMLQLVLLEWVIVWCEQFAWSCIINRDKPRLSVDVTFFNIVQCTLKRINGNHIWT